MALFIPPPNTDIRTVQTLMGHASVEPSDIDWSKATARRVAAAAAINPP